MRNNQTFRIKSAQICAVLLSLCLTAGCGGGGGDTNPPPTTAAPSNLSYPSPQQFVAGQSMNELAPTVTGSVTNYSVSPALPPGLTIDSTTGYITGTPQQAAPQATYNITASNSAGSTSFALVFSIATDSFWVEPKQSSTIGVDQLIQVYAALQKSSQAYPQYPDTATLTFQSSDPSVASVDSEGHVVGVHEGTSVVSVSDGFHTSQVSITVAGSMIRRTVTVAGQGDRDYWIYTPNFSSASPHPAIVSMHGAGGSAMIQASMTQLNVLGARQGIYIVYLDGTGDLIPTFNAGGCCGFAETQNIDDVLYVSRVLDDVSAKYSIDATKTFASGFSNGAMMSHRLACALSDRFAGIAAVAGGSAEFDKDGTQYFVCNPQRPIPILHIHALNDRNYPYAGGAGEGISNYNFYSVDSTIHDWVVRNNVTDDVRTEQVTATTTCYRHETPAEIAKPSAPVVLCKLDPPDVFDSVNGIVFGGGHSWPGGVKSPAAGSDVPGSDFDANSYLWKFFTE